LILFDFLLSHTITVISAAEKMELWVWFCSAILFFQKQTGRGRKHSGWFLETNWWFSETNWV